MLLPPMRKLPLDVLIEPACANVPASVPLTYSRSVAPSYVDARCVHAFSGICPVPTAENELVPCRIHASGRCGALPPLLSAYRPYARSPLASFRITFSQELISVG